MWKQYTLKRKDKEATSDVVYNVEPTAGCNYYIKLEAIQCCCDTYRVLYADIFDNTIMICILKQANV